MTEINPNIDADDPEFESIITGIFDRSQTNRDPEIAFGGEDGKPALLGVVGPDTSAPTDNVKMGALYADYSALGWWNFDSTGDIDLHHRDPDDSNLDVTPFQIGPPDGSAGTLGKMASAVGQVQFTAGWRDGGYNFGERLDALLTGYDDNGVTLRFRNLPTNGSATDEWSIRHQPTTEGRLLFLNETDSDYIFSLYRPGTSLAPDGSTGAVNVGGALIAPREVGPQPSATDLAKGEQAFTSDRDGAGNASWLYRTNGGTAHYWDADGTL